MLIRRVTLGQLAEATGLSRSGVSRAMRNDPRVPSETCARVQTAAAKLGYQPDPEVTSAMRLLRVRRTNRYVETLGFFSWHHDRIEKAGNLYTKCLFHGARDHATALGYKLEDFWMNEPGMTPRRLQTVLASRGVRGCLLGPMTDDVVNFPFAWPRFSVVAATYALPSLVTHRTLPANFINTQQAFLHCLKLGYRRIGLMIDHYINERTNHTVRAAFLDSQSSNPDLLNIPVLELENLGPDPGADSHHSPEWAHFHRWQREHTPDVILSSRVVFHSWLTKAGLSCPDDIGFVSLEGVNVNDRFTHIDQCPERVGAAGIDLLTSVLNRNERGIPSVPLTITITGSWVAGKSTRRLQVAMD